MPVRPYPTEHSPLRVGSPFITRPYSVLLEDSLTPEAMQKVFGGFPHPNDIGAMASAADGTKVVLSATPSGHAIVSRVVPAYYGTSGPFQGPPVHEAYRSFHSNGEVDNDDIRIPPDSPMSRSGHDLLRAQVEALARHGFTRISAHGAGDPTSFESLKEGGKGLVGYFKWVKHGFDQVLEPRHIRDINAAGIGIRLDPRKRYRISTLLDKYPDFYEHWKNDVGSDLHDLRFDLSPQSRSMQVLRRTTKWFGDRGMPALTKGVEGGRREDRGGTAHEDPQPTGRGEPTAAGGTAGARRLARRDTAAQAHHRQVRGGVTRYAAPKLVPPFYSKAEQVIREKVPEIVHPDQVRNTLLNNGVKPEEMKWSGLDSHLASAVGPVTKGELLRTVREQTPKIHEILKGDFSKEDRNSLPDGSGDAPRHSDSSRVLPGGNNYREMLLQLQHPVNITPGFEYKKVGDRWNLLEEGTGRLLASHPTEQEARRDFEHRYAKLPPEPEDYISPLEHWDEPNVLAHVRFNDRTGPNGEKLLHLEELQSDWHSDGRKKGYKGQRADPVQWKEHSWGLKTDGAHIFYDQDGRFRLQYDGDPYIQVRYFNVDDAKNAVQRTADEESSWNRVPDAPFKKTWHELLLKRMLRYAAEHGYHGISWTPGKEQTDRYNLAKYISSVEYRPNYSNHLTAYDHNGKSVLDKSVPPEKLKDYVGEEVAYKLLNSEPQYHSGSGTPVHRVEGLDLVSGGDGMRGFYDKIVPDYLNKLGKRFNTRVGTTEIPLSHDASFSNIDRALDILNRGGEVYGVNRHGQEELITSLAELRDRPWMGFVGGDKQPGRQVPYFPIPDEMRQEVLHRGQARFSRRRYAQGRGDAQSVATSMGGVMSHNQQSINSIARDIATELRMLPATGTDAVHVSPMGSRPSMVVRARTPKFDKAVYAASWLGLMTRQPGMVVFTPGEGKDLLHTLHSRMSGAQVTAALNSVGVRDAVLVPNPTGVEAIVYDREAKSGAAIRDMAQRSKMSLRSRQGSGSFVGADEEAQSRAAYRHVIRSYEQRLQQSQPEQQQPAQQLPQQSNGVSQMRRRYSRVSDVVDSIHQNNPDVHVSMYESDHGSGKLWRVHSIKVEKSKRGHGIGSKVLGEIVSHADKHGVTVALSPTKDFGASSVGRLRKFYGRFGFVDNTKRRDRDFTISETMVRRPKQTPEQMQRQYARRVTKSDVDAMFSDSLGMDRADMPQVPDDKKNKFLMGMVRSGIGHRDELVHPDTLKPSQREWSPESLRRVKESVDGGGEERDRVLRNRVTVSKDNYVLDGHHRWLDHKIRGRKLRVVRVDLPIEQLIHAAAKFGESEGIGRKDA